MRVTMAPGHHFVPAWAMAFDSIDGPARRFAYTSDTSMNETVIDRVRNADLLMAEAAVMKQSKPADEQGHLTPGEAGCLARDAGAKRLLITHYPSVSAASILSDAAACFDGPCELALEGARFII